MDNDVNGWKSTLEAADEFRKIITILEASLTAANTTIAKKDVEISELKNRLSSFKRWDGQPFAVTDAVWIEPGRVLESTKPKE